MNNINPNNYIPGNTYVAPADGQGVENKEGLTGQGTTMSQVTKQCTRPRNVKCCPS